MKTKTIPTPLSRAQKRLEFWREQLKARMKPNPVMVSGSIVVSIAEDKAFEKKLVEEARAAVKDWESIVRAVILHETSQRIFDALKRWTDHGNMPKYDSLMADGDETFGEAIDDAIVKFRAVKP